MFDNDLIFLIPIILLVLLFMFRVKINRAGNELDKKN